MSEESIIVNALVRQALVASEEVMGVNGLNIVLKSAGLEQFVGNYPPDNLEPSIKTAQYARLNQAIESFYGRGGRGFLRRIGKASFQYATREQTALLGLAGVALKVLPKKQRILFILNSMVNALKKTNPQVDAWVDESEGQVAFVDRTCAICHQRASDRPICHLYVGSLTEAVQWATGTEHQITETHCAAQGDEYCRFEIGEPLS